MEQAQRIAVEAEPAAAERDEELASAARSDPAAFALIYRRHRLSVFRYIRSRTRDDDAAADLTSIVFERALAAMPRYRPTGGGILAWLLRIARNAVIDASRRGAALPLTGPLRDAPGPDSPEQALLEDEGRRQLLAAVGRLPAVQRDAIVLRYGSRLTARQIGEVLGKSEQATQKLLSRALSSIRESYRADD